MDMEISKTHGLASALTAVACVMLAAGCAAEPLATEVPEGEVAWSTGRAAALYVINASGWTLIPSPCKVHDKADLIAYVHRGHFQKALIGLGQHDLYVRNAFPSDRPDISLDAEGGASYYLEIAYSPLRSWAFPFAGNPLFVGMITAEEAQPLMRKMSSE
jgi:hypothetical protein